MNRNENGIHITNGFFTETYNISNTLRPMEGKRLKRILAYLDCTKYNEIDLGHLPIQKPVSYKK